MRVSRPALIGALAIAAATLGGLLGATLSRAAPGVRLQVPVTHYEIEAVADMVCREARDEPFHGQMAVAYVVENRRRSTVWPGSIGAVLGQSGQFNALHDARHDAECRRGSDTWQRARRASAIALTDLDANNGATFFDRCDSAPRWMREKDLKAAIGNHCFWGESDVAPR